MNCDDAAYELIRCAIHFSDQHRDKEHDGYYHAMLNEIVNIIHSPVFEIKIKPTNRGIDYQLIVTHDAGVFTMHRMRRPFEVYNWLEDRFYSAA